MITRRMIKHIAATATHSASKYRGKAGHFECVNLSWDRLVQELERVLSSRFTIVEIEHTTKPFAAMNRIIG